MPRFLPSEVKNDARNFVSLHIRLLNPNRLHDTPNALLHLPPILPPAPLPCNLRRRPPRAPHNPRDNGRLWHLDPWRFLQLQIIPGGKECLVVPGAVGLVAPVVVGLPGAGAAAAARARVGLAVDDAGGGAAGAAVREGGEGREADADDAGGDFGGAK